jgi:ribulose-5-phosphate 4-epimerase/fuculose-1-phosphate aldolase
MCSAEIALSNEYEGPVADKSNASEAIRGLGSANAALLANHGVMVIGSDIQDAYIRAMVLEWRCRQAWHVETLGPGVPMNEEIARNVPAQIAMSPNGFDGVFEAMCRRVIRKDPSVLD